MDTCLVMQAVDQMSNPNQSVGNSHQVCICVLDRAQSHAICLLIFLNKKREQGEWLLDSWVQITHYVLGDQTPTFGAQKSDWSLKVNLSSFNSSCKRRKILSYHEEATSSSRKEELTKELISDRRFWNPKLQGHCSSKTSHLAKKLVQKCDWILRKRKRQN